MRMHTQARHLEPGDVVLQRAGVVLPEPVTVKFIDRTLSGGLAVWRPGQPPLSLARHTPVVIERAVRPRLNSRALAGWPSPHYHH